MQKRKQSMNQTGGKDMRDREPYMYKKNRNQGFTLVEAVIAVSIMGVLLGVMSLSINVIPNFRAQRAAKSITAALDRTRTEAMNRLVGEMVLEKREDGYYISYYLDRGKSGSENIVSQEEAEKIAPSGTRISYTTSSDADAEISLENDQKIILTYDRATGAFLPMQDQPLTQKDILETLGKGQDIPLKRDGNYCTSIIVKGGSHTSRIMLKKDTGTYTVNVG